MLPGDYIAEQAVQFVLLVGVRVPAGNGRVHNLHYPLFQFSPVAAQHVEHYLLIMLLSRSFQSHDIVNLAFDIRFLYLGADQFGEGDGRGRAFLLYPYASEQRAHEI